MPRLTIVRMVTDRRLAERLARRAFALMLAAALTTSATHAQPAPNPAPNADIEAAEQAYADLDYAEANRLAESLSKQRGLSHDQLVRVTRILGVTHAALGHEAAAKDAFVALLAYDPDFRADPYLGPRVHQPFVEARGFWRGQSVKPGIEVTTVLRPREPGTLRVTTRDPTHIVRRITVGFRWGATGEMTTTTIPAGDSVPLEVPAPPASITRFDYYAQALDDRDAAVFETGNPRAPKTAVIVDVAPSPTPAVPKGEKNRSIFASPVFWVVTTAVLAGSATGVYLATHKREKTSPATQGSLTPTLGCGFGRCD